MAVRKGAQQLFGGKLQLYGRCPDHLRLFRGRVTFSGHCPENSHRVGGIEGGESLRDGLRNLRIGAVETYISVKSLAIRGRDFVGA